MTLDERYNEVLKSHASFLNAVGVASAGGGGFAAIASDNLMAAFLFIMLSLSLHIAATEVLERMRVN
jgi:hypothetical protein